jgi:hypothetical protein
LITKCHCFICVIWHSFCYFISGAVASSILYRWQVRRSIPVPICVLVDIVIKRKLNHAETPALNTYYNNINISDNIEVFRHAETTKGVYRDCTVEADHQRESACIVHYCNYVGRIGYFFHHSCSGTAWTFLDKLNRASEKRRREPMLLCGEDLHCSKSCCWSTRAIHPVNLFTRGWDHVDPIFVVIKNLKQCWSCVYIRNTVKPNPE